MKITVQHVDGLRFLATAGEHTLVMDASQEDGGTGTAMSTPQLFGAAVGACICEFVANSCRLRGISFERLSLEVVCEESAGPRRVGALEATIRMEPEPPEEARRQLVGIAQHATLVNTFARPPAVVIRFAGE